MDYLIVFCWCFLSASLLPLSSEPYFVAVIIQKQLIAIPVLIATLGNLLGGITTFFIGRKGGEIAAEKLSGKNKIRYEKAISYSKKFGPPILFISWVPIIGDIVVAAGGALRLPIASSIIWMLLGKFFRYLLLALAVLGLWNYFGW